jgi:hypothetical protein
MLPDRRYIDDVVPGRRYADILQLRELLQTCRVKWHLVGNNRSGITNPRQDLIRSGPVINLEVTQLFQGSPIEITGISRMAIENNDFHKTLMPN